MKKAEMESLCGGSEALMALCCGQGFCAARAEVTFENRAFCFTGRSVHGRRKEMEQAVISHGGRVHPRVTLGTDYLVVGRLGSPGWKCGTYGRKIAQAAHIKSRGGRVVIVSEMDFWRDNGHAEKKEETK